MNYLILVIDGIKLLNNLKRECDKCHILSGLLLFYFPYTMQLPARDIQV